MSFMMQIEAAQRPPLDQLAFDFLQIPRSEHPPLDFCRQTLGVPEDDEVVARCLRVAVSEVRGWRDVGRRATPGRWSCR